MEQLEKDVLAWISEHNASEALRSQLAAATVKKRDYMRTGFFVYFEVPHEGMRVEPGFRTRCPDLQAPELVHGAGSSLFLRDGRVHYLELYARGGFFPRELKRYSLVTPDQ